MKHRASSRRTNTSSSPPSGKSGESRRGRRRRRSRRRRVASCCRSGAPVRRVPSLLHGSSNRPRSLNPCHPLLGSSSRRPLQTRRHRRFGRSSRLPVWNPDLRLPGSSSRRRYPNHRLLCARRQPCPFLPPQPATPNTQICSPSSSLPMTSSTSSSRPSINRDFSS
jgi:hypothetical protein